VGWGRGLFLVSIVVALAACVTAEDRAENETKVAAAREESGVRVRRERMSKAEAEAFFVGKTRVSSAFDRGSQVSYMAPDGSIYLWFPGNSVVLRGQWTLEETGAYRVYAGRPVSETSVCFRYGPDTVNAWSGERGRKSCIPADTLARMAFDRAEGDVFGLSQRTQAPFVLPPERATIADLRKRIGR
jgi:hypothetical protein